MDIMDSSDTPSGGLTTNTSSSSALPLSVDQRDAFASPTNRSTYGGQQPTSFSSGFSSGSSAMDRMDAVRSVNNDDYNSMPTSTDDVMMPHVEYASHPSMLTGTNSSLTSSTSSDLPTAQQVKDKAASAMDSAKDKASAARDAAGDMTDSARAKAGDLADSAKVKASHLQDKMEDAADTVKEKLREGMEKVKSTLHSAEHTVEDKYEHVKDDLAARRDAHTTTTTATAPVVRSTISNEPTDTHPSASSMRDSHLHPGLSALPSHGNEIKADKSNPYMSNAHHSALIAGDEAHARAVAEAGVEPKDASSREGTGLLFRMHDKLEEGVEAVKEKVDGFMERNVRTDDTHHLSAAKSSDFPTLIDNSNTHNTNQVRAKMHPSQERLSTAEAEELDELA